jgi:hypothetical protein
MRREVMASMENRTDLLHTKSGMLTVVEKVNERTKAGYAKYYCRCDCGGSVVISSQALRRKDTVSSCGCINAAVLKKVRCKRPVPPLDLVGKKFGRLYVSELLSERRSGGAVFLCKCDCGNTKKIIGSSLVKKIKPTRSCGCLSIEANRKIGDNRREDLTGQRFGCLVVDGLSKKRTGCRDRYWNVTCDCGNSTAVRRQSLITGETKSCGCMQQQGNIKKRVMPAYVYDDKITPKHRYKAKYLTDAYVKNVLVAHTELKSAALSSGLVDAKRLQIKIIRELKK